MTRAERDELARRLAEAKVLLDRSLIDLEAGAPLGLSTVEKLDAAARRVAGVNSDLRRHAINEARAQAVAAVANAKVVP